jgi:hypothetical protein
MPQPHDLPWGVCVCVCVCVCACATVDVIFATDDSVLGAEAALVLSAVFEQPAVRRLSFAACARALRWSTGGGCPIQAAGNPNAALAALQGRVVASADRLWARASDGLAMAVSNLGAALGAWRDESADESVTTPFSSSALLQPGC